MCFTREQSDIYFTLASFKGKTESLLCYFHPRREINKSSTLSFYVFVGDVSPSADYHSLKVSFSHVYFHETRTKQGPKKKHFKLSHYLQG